MKLKTSLILFAFLYVSGCSQFLNQLSGTQPTPLTRVYQLRTDYTAALKVLVQARMLGKITDAQYVQIEAQRQTAASALDGLEAQAAAGQPINETLLQQASLAVDALIVAKAQYQ